MITAEAITDPSFITSRNFFLRKSPTLERSITTLDGRRRWVLGPSSIRPPAALQTSPSAARRAARSAC
ncbi:MAG: hypothetical protein H6711_16805 [Myxococcales bacterium]|nr:hypothetical protein [Myxococcales bacterium]